MRKLILCISIVSLNISCNTTEPHHSNEQILLELIEVSVTEVYLQLRLIGLSSGNVSIIGDKQVLLDFHMNNQDTSIIIDELNPGTVYEFKAKLINGFDPFNNCSTIEVETLMPTNHNIEWEKIDFNWTGLLADVAVIGSDNIWAVGDYYIDDSASTVHFNSIHWDGTKWNFIQIPAKIWNINEFVPAKLEAISAISENNIWVTTGSELIHYDGNSWGDWKFLFESLDDTLGNITRLWVSKNNELWGAGRRGRIIKYSNSVLKEFEIGTQSNVTDIWGSYSADSNEQIIYCSIPNDSKLVVINDKEEITILDIGDIDPHAITSVWANNVYPVYGCGFGIFRSFNGRWMQEEYDGIIQVLKIKGDGLNNIFAVGYDKIAHYNGIYWDINATMLTSGSIVYVVDIKNNIVTLVGRNGISPILILGYQ
jgi:hypothetical protein